jgi:voltage-gated potassium channel
VPRLLDIRGFRWATILAVSGVLAGGTLYAAIEEGVGWFDGIWWAMSTITTVGYGDEFPRDDAGRAVGMALMVLAPFIIGLVALGVAHTFAAEVEQEVEHEVDRREDEVLARLDEISRRLDALERRF